MRLIASVMLLAALLTLGVTGCRSSSRSAPIAGEAVEPVQAPAVANEAMIASDTGGEDEDFSLFEEEFSEEAVEVADPLEPWNRLMFKVNDKVHLHVLKPVAEGYRKVVPALVRMGVRNFFRNLTTPIRLVNCLLQGKGEGARTEAARFAVNSTVGVLGVGDPALDQLGWKPAEEDLGQTLAVHNVGNGFYIVWPLLGPSTLRDSAGMVGDRFLSPVTYLQPSRLRTGVYVFRGANEASFHVGDYEAMKAGLLEPYVAMRDAYIQYRNTRIQE